MIMALKIKYTCIFKYLGQKIILKYNKQKPEIEVSSTLSQYLEQLRQKRTKVFQIATVKPLQIPWRNPRTQPQLMEPNDAILHGSKKCRIWGSLKSCTWMMQCNPLLYWLFYVPGRGGGGEAKLKI